MKKIIFVDGFYSFGMGSYLFLKVLLKSNFQMIPFKYDYRGYEKIEDTAKKLNNFINNLGLKKKEKVSIIAFSMGGLISTYYIKFLDSKKVNKLVSIFSPFHGTFWANIFFKNRPAVKEMRPNSKFLTKLNKKDLKRSIKHLNIYSPEDFVVPGNSGKYLKSDSVRVFFFMHPFAVFWPKLVYNVRNFLEGKPYKYF